MPWSCTEGASTAALTRRDCLTGALALLGAGAAVGASQPGTPASAADTALRAALDTLWRRRAAQGERSAPAEQLATLAAFDTAMLSPSAAIDLDTVRAGLALDAELTGASASGDEASVYALRIARAIGERMHPASAHGALQTEVTRLAARADQLLRELGLRRGTLGERFVAMAARQEYLYTADDAGRDALVAYMNRWLDRIRVRLPSSFTDVPDYCLQVRVERLSSADMATGRPGYRRLPSTANRGAYVIDLRDMGRRPRWTLPSVVHHELLPGHLLQLPLEAAASAHPLRLEYLRAYSEGWATYAEELVADDGIYRGDRESELGLVHWLLFRALRGLADTGIHQQGWSSSGALARLHELQGFPAYFAAFEADVARIVAEPGARAAEALAWLRLRALSGASTGRGQRPAFHRLALCYGRQPLVRLSTLARQL